MGGEGGQQRGNLRRKKKIITFRWELIYFAMTFASFAWQLQRTIQGWKRVRKSFLMADKGVYHLQKVGLPHQERRGCKWHINKTQWLPVWAPDIHTALDMCSISSSWTSGDLALKMAIVCSVSVWVHMTECTFMCTEIFKHVHVLQHSSKS